MMVSVGALIAGDLLLADVRDILAPSDDQRRAREADAVRITDDLIRDVVAFFEFSGDGILAD